MLRFLSTLVRRHGTATALALALGAPAALAADAPAAPPPSMPAAAAPCAMPPHGNAGARRARWFAHLLRRVHATPAQRAQIRHIMRQARIDSRATVARLRALHARQMRLLAAPTLDKVALESLRVDSMHLIDQLSIHALHTKEAVAAVLTAEQRAHMRVLLQRAAQRHGHRF